MNAISLDLRQRILHAIQNENNTPQQAAKRFVISRASIYRYLEQYRNQGTLQPAQRIISPRRITAEQLPRLQRQLEAHNDSTLEEHCQLWTEQTNVPVSASTMRRAFKRLSITLKKDNSTR
jgi:transposase